MMEVDPVSGAITMDSGDYFDPQFAIVDAAGNPLDVTGATFTLTVAKSIDDPIGSALWQLTTGVAGFDVSGQVGGIIKGQGAETLTQPLAGDFFYDLQMALGGKTRTVQKAARLRIRKVVTKPGSPPASPGAGVVFPSYIVVPSIIYQQGLDGLWHKYQPDANGVWGETAPPQAGAPPF